MPRIYAVVRYHEVALKGGNRALFVRQLGNNAFRMLRGLGAIKVRRAPGRLLIELTPEAEWPEIRTRLQRCFGVAKILLCRRTQRSLEGLSRAILEALPQPPPESFAVRTKRTDKTYPVLSPEISSRIGRVVQEKTGSRVDLSHPALEIHVEVLPHQFLFPLEKVDGPGGLPVGSSGSALALLSGGIDSPVAAHRIMRRGCRIDFVHFHGAPFQSSASRDKVAELVEVLTRWQPDSTLHLVPFGLVQREIVKRAPRRLRVVLYRRMMLRIAEAIARNIGAEALVTGDSLGQVASQTLPNLAVVGAATSLLLLRPLVGLDKSEITEHAQRIGTFDISIQPDEDCCQLFTPRHPATRTTLEEVAAAESELDIAVLRDSALAKAESSDFSFPPQRTAPALSPELLSRTSR
jgi:tRNA uracil 4-sulfurtransferase